MLRAGELENIKRIVHRINIDTTQQRGKYFMINAMSPESQLCHQCKIEHQTRSKRRRGYRTPRGQRERRGKRQPHRGTFRKAFLPKFRREFSLVSISGIRRGKAVEPNDWALLNKSRIFLYCMCWLMCQCAINSFFIYKSFE